ncbi:TPA: VOC family protein [Streptococcus agalactiae]|nr:VOC family protein [Streptococcus agalactiae]HEO1031692.1 VOC family protein [Streptococcus agalactiae]
MPFLHTCIRVKDLDASIAFYQEALGFKEVRRNDFPENQFTLVYMALEDDPSYELELTYNYDHEAYDLGNMFYFIQDPDGYKIEVIRLSQFKAD